jgi:hypothetical protein
LQLKNLDSEVRTIPGSFVLQFRLELDLSSVGAGLEATGIG